MKNSFIIYRFLVMSTMIWLTACQSNTQKAETSSLVQTDTIISDTINNSNDSVENAEDSKIEIMLLPSPDELLNEIFGENLKYNPSVLNSLKNESKYLNVKSQALNLGIYLTDLAYLNLNNDKTEAFRYFKTIRELAQKLNIYQPFYGDLYNRVQKNVANQDSMNAIFRDLYYRMLEALELSKQNDVYAFMVTGALVESLYIPAMITEKETEHKVIATKIFEQKYLINNFYDHLTQYKNEKYINEVLIILNDIKEILNKAETKTAEKVIIEKDRGNFIISGGDEIIVSEKMLMMISKRIKEIRGEIVNSN